MANIEHVNVAGQVYDIRVPNGSSLSLSSLNVTGTITGANLNLGSGTITAGTANLSVVNCAGLTCLGQLTTRSANAQTLTVSSVSVTVGLTANTLTVTGPSKLGSVSCTSLTCSGRVTSNSVSVTTLTTQTLKVNGTSNLSHVNCASLSTNKNIVIRHDSLDINITWYGKDTGTGEYRWAISSISAASDILCTFNLFSATSHPDHILPTTLKVKGLGNPNYYIAVDFNALKNLGVNAFEQPSSDPVGSETSITSQSYSFDYILFGAQVI